MIQLDLRCPTLTPTGHGVTDERIAAISLGVKRRLFDALMILRKARQGAWRTIGESDCTWGVR